MRIKSPPFQLIAVVFCFFLSRQHSTAQHKKDSLWQAWQNEKLADTLRIRAVEAYLDDYIYNNAEETIRVSQELIAYGEKINNYATVAGAYNTLSRGYYFKGDTQESFNHLKTSTDFSYKANDIEGALLSQLNLVSFFEDSYLEPLEAQAILHEVDSIASEYRLWSIAADSKYTTIISSNINGDYALALRKLGELELLLTNPTITVDDTNGRLFYGLANGYKALEKYEKAKEFFTKSIPKSRETSKIHRLYQRGENNLILGDTLAAIEDYKEGFEISFATDSTALDLKERNYAGALYHYYSGNYTEAEPLFTSVLDYNKKTNRLSAISYSYVYLARIAFKEKDFTKAIALSEEGLDYPKEHFHLEHQLEFYRILYASYKQKGDATQALTYFEKYKMLNEQLFNKERTKAIAVQEAENAFAVERQQTEFKYEADLLIEEQRRKNIRNGLLGALGLASLGFLVVINLKKRKSAQREQALQETFTQQLLQNTEDERSRIAGDLHDSVNHQLLQLKQKALSGKSIDDKELTAIIDQVRSISHNLTPTMFEKLGLTKSVEELCRNIMEASPLLISTQFDYDNTLSKNQELQIYRIVEEALNNILKHSKASHALIHIDNKNSHLELKIKDNGIGFEDNDSDKEGFNFGLTNMKIRAKSIKGLLDLKSNDKGTTLNLKMTT